MNDTIRQAEEYITKLFQNNTDGHDAEHSMRVYRTAMAIAEKTDDCDKEIVALGALLHDADDYKLFSTENNANARSFLGNIGISKEEKEKIIHVK